MIVKLILAPCKLPINLQNLQPHLDALLLQALEISSQQTLLEYLFSQDFVHVLIEAYQVSQSLLGVDKPNCKAEDLRDVVEAKLVQPLTPLRERCSDHLLFTKHSLRVFLIALQFRQQNMHFAFLHLVHVAKIYEQLVCLIEWHGHDAKVLDEF